MSEGHASEAVVSRDEAKCSGKHCVVASIGDNAPIVSPLYETEDEAHAAKRTLRGDFPGAVVCYWPTPEELKELHRRQAAARKWDVTYWQVVEPQTLDDSGTRAIVPISAMYATRELAENALEAIRRKLPGAYVQWGTLFFSENSPEDMRARSEILAELVDSHPR